MHRYYIAAALALAALTSSCGRQARLSQAEQDALARAPVALEVTNDNPLDIVVYLRVGEERRRLGMVTTGQTASFELDPATLRGFSDVRIVVDPIGEGVEYTSDRLMVGPGEAIQVRVGATLQRTTVSTG